MPIAGCKVFRSFIAEGHAELYCFHGSFGDDGLRHIALSHWTSPAPPFTLSIMAKGRVSLSDKSGTETRFQPATTVILNHGAGGAT
jgi:hypothetical protein